MILPIQQKTLPASESRKRSYCWINDIKFLFRLGKQSVDELTGKLRRGSLRYIEAVELANVMGYDLVWVKRREVR